MNQIKRAFTTMLKRCLYLNKYLRNEELLYAIDLEPINNMIMRKKLVGLKAIIYSPLTCNTMFAVMEKTRNSTNGKSIRKKSMVSECLEAMENMGLVVNKNNILDKAKESLKMLDDVREVNRESERVRKIHALLSEPTLENWYEINRLLIPDSIAHLQDDYWGNLFDDRQVINSEFEDEDNDNMWEPNSNNSSFDAG